MSELDEPDGISRQLDAIFAEYFSLPTEMDLRGVDPATFVLGLSYGFDSWQHVRVVANNRRKVAMASQRWAERHPSTEFLSHAVGTDERALGHQQLLERAHPECDSCAERLRQMSAAALDRVDPYAVPDGLDQEWQTFQLVGMTRHAETEAPGAHGRLHVPGQSADESITAEHFGGRRWRITVRHPSAAGATIRVRWSDGHTDRYAMTFQNDLADIAAEAPEEGAHPAQVSVMFTDSPGSA